MVAHPYYEHLITFLLIIFLPCSNKVLTFLQRLLGLLYGVDDDMVLIAPYAEASFSQTSSLKWKLFLIWMLAFIQLDPLH